MADAVVMGLLGYTDLNIGYGTFGPVTLMDGSSSLLSKIPPGPFVDVKAPPYAAAGNGTTDDTATINAALTDVGNVGGGVVFVPFGNYKISNRITVPANVLLLGIGIGSKFVSAIPQGLTEMVRLGGDYAAIDSMWLHGTGQGDGSFSNGSRGIWIGNTPDYVAEGRVNNARVQNCVIDAFIGNGISGDYWYAKIVNNVVFNNTDANIFLQPTSNHNLLQGNNVYASRYSGFDINGSHNRFIGNDSHGNGTCLGILDQGSMSGFLIAGTTPADGLPSASRNTFIGNQAWGNMAAGFLIGSQGSTPATTGPYGNLFIGNVATGHTNALNYLGSVMQAWVGGFVNLGGDSTVFQGNFSEGNVFNYVMAGGVIRNSSGCQVLGNNSLGALHNSDLAGISQPSGVGYLFPGAAHMDTGVAGHPVDGLIIRDNWDRYSASDSFRFDLCLAVSGNVWNGATIAGNNSDHSGGYGFNLVSPNQFVGIYFDGITNYVTNATLGNSNGFSRLGLTQNSLTPSVLHGQWWVTQNTVPTTYTNFLDGIFNQQINILINDANTTFNFNSGNLKGNFSTNYAALAGDWIKATYDGTNWYCDVFHAGPACVFANVNQATNKSTDVIQNNTLSGQITTHSGAAANADVIFRNSFKSFNLLNNKFTGSRDMVSIWQSGGPHNNFYKISWADGGNGVIAVIMQNTDATTDYDDTIILQYEIRKR